MKVRQLFSQQKTVCKHLLLKLGKAGGRLSFRVFGLLSSSLLSSQHFCRYVLRPSSGVSCRIQKPTRNFESNHLLNPNCFNSVNHNRVQVLNYSNLQMILPQNIFTKRLYPLHHVSCREFGLFFFGKISFSIKKKKKKKKKELSLGELFRKNHGLHVVHVMSRGS